MAMSRSELKAAIREGYSHEFDSIPTQESEINLTISTHFENKMNQLIDKETKKSWHMINTPYKKVIALVAALILMFTMTFSVSAIREPVANFFIEIYETFTEYLFDGDTSDSINTEYGFSEVPKGFEIIDSYKDENLIKSTYKNSDGNTLEITQIVTDGTNFSLDSENGNVKIITTLDNEIRIYAQQNLTQAIWIEEGYLFTLTYEGDIEEDEILQLVSLIGICD